MQKLLARLASGAVAGIAATAVMSLSMLAAKRWGILGEPPPRRITRRLLAPVAPYGRRLDYAALAAHFAFGASMGTVFAGLPTSLRKVGGGILFGSAVWVVNYAGVLPKLGLMPPVRRDRPGRPTAMLFSHWVYGAALSLLHRYVQPAARPVKGRVAVVCGGSRGLGRALARELVQSGARVAICGREPGPLEQTRQWLAAFGQPVLADICDLRSEEQTRIFLQRVERELGPIDVLIANAATIDVGAVETLEAKEFRAAMDEIFGSALHATLAVLPSMRARGRGSIALITSIGGKLGVPHLAPYSAAKFAEVGLAEALHAEVAKDGVRVLTVAPGLMRTGSHLHATFRGNPERELLWFGASTVAPLLSIDADRAARLIVRAIEHDERYLTFTPAARLGLRLHDAAPELWAALFGVVGWMLPTSSPNRLRGEGLEGQVLMASSGSRLLDLLRRRTIPLSERHGQ